jgi:hypothetical protein
MMLTGGEPIGSLPFISFYVGSTPFNSGELWEMELFLAVVTTVISLLLFTIASITLRWMMHAWRTPETLAGTRFAEPDGVCALSFSILVPARHEQDVLAHTVTRLLDSTHTG